MELTDTIQSLASVDIFKEAKKEELFVGRPFYIDYSTANLLISDAWKAKVGGVPQGAFLLAFYENEEDVLEALLLRAIKPTRLPTDGDVISSMIEYYKDNLKTTGTSSQLDDFTRYHFSFSGLECRILGTLYKEKDGSGKIRTVFGADVENFYSAHNYSVYKPTEKVLELIANFRDGSNMPGGKSDARVGVVRYSSSKRHHDSIGSVPVYVSPNDFLGRRTALFGMTRTGKSNTVKKIIQSTVEISQVAERKLSDSLPEGVNPSGKFEDNGCPRYPSGQIIFDVNGEYANANLQDEGTAIFDLYKGDTIRYSEIEKPGFEVMKVNFYKELEAGFNLIVEHFRNTGEKSSDYFGAFLNISLEVPDDYSQDFSVKTRFDRIKAAYLCCLYRAGFTVPAGFTVKFSGQKELNEKIREENPIDPNREGGISLEEAATWFTWVWENYETEPYFTEYEKKKGKEWAEEDLKSLLRVLTKKKDSKGAASVSGFGKLISLRSLHTGKGEKPFTDAIINHLRQGKIVIVDLSQGNPDIQKLYSERICREVFADSMRRFINNQPNNFVQFYFEEAHNLFPKKDEKDLSQIYNRIAKEGAKLNLGLIYATQEVSSISSNILKNTQNWFIAHLNNEDEIKELRKYYDFGDFADGLIRFSSSSDQGFVRMKTYSNPYIVPVQVDKFSVK